MELLAAISFLAMVLSGLLVGGRLLALARQTGRAPELFLGLGTLLLALAAVAEVSALELHGHEVAGTYPLEVLALFLHSASASSLGFGVWCVFHPDRPWALLGSLALCSLLASSWLAVALPGGYLRVGFTGWHHLHVAARGVAFLWAAVEVSLHYVRMRRRRALGLASRFECHRFLLWAVAMASSAAILAVALATNVLVDRLVYAWPPALLAVSGLGLLGAATLWVAFLPPVAYRRLIEPAAVT